MMNKEKPPLFNSTKLANNAAHLPHAIFHHQPIPQL